MKCIQKLFLFIFSVSICFQILSCAEKKNFEKVNQEMESYISEISLKYCIQCDNNLRGCGNSCTESGMYRDVRCDKFLENVSKKDFNKELDNQISKISQYKSDYISFKKEDVKSLSTEEYTYNVKNLDEWIEYLKKLKACGKME